MEQRRKPENFTAERVVGYKCEAGRQQTIFRDAKTPGLGLRATSAGGKSYIFETRLHGKTLRVTIGDLRTWTIREAQAEARRLKTLTDQGIDPRQVEAEQAAEDEARRTAAAEDDRRQSLTVAGAWADFIAYQKDKMGRAHIKRGKKWGERHLLDHERLTQAGGEPHKRGGGVTVAGPLFPLLAMRMTDINAVTLKAWQRKEAERRGNNARQAFEMFRAFWRWCARQDDYRNIIDAEAVEDKKVRDEVPGRKTKKFDSIEREQLPEWFKAVRQIQNPVIAAYLQTLLLSGARREELAGLKWDDIDFRWNALTIHDKVEGERTIPLTPYVASLLAALPRRNEWVFSSPMAASGRLQEPSIQHRRACAVAGLDVSLHGLRRSFASLAEWTEMPAGIVAQIMGHKPSATAEKHYKRRPLDLLRLWHGKYEAWILEQAGIEFEQDQTGLKLVSIA